MQLQPREPAQHQRPAALGPALDRPQLSEALDQRAKGDLRLQSRHLHAMLGAQQFGMVLTGQGLQPRLFQDRLSVTQLLRRRHLVIEWSLQQRVESGLRDEQCVASFGGRGPGSARLDVRCPIGADVVVGTVAGQVELRGQLGAVRVTTVSGSVEVDRADSVELRDVEPGQGV